MVIKVPRRTTLLNKPNLSQANAGKPALTDTDGWRITALFEAARRHT